MIIYKKYSLESIDKSQNRYRFYKIFIGRGLFEYILTRNWGRIKTNGCIKTQSFDTLEEAETASKKIVERRLKRGYKIVNISIK